MKIEKWKNESSALWLYVVASCGPLALGGITILMGKAHEATGGGEWTEGAFLGFIVIPVAGLLFVLSSLIAVLLSLYIRSFSTIVLSIYNFSILTVVYLSRNALFESIEILSVLYIFFSISSVYFLNKYYRNNRFTFEKI